VVVLIARFVAVLRSVVGFIAGANRMPFANFMIANSAGAVAWALFYGLGAYYLGKGLEEFARPFAMALAVVGAIVVVLMIFYWRRKEQELAAAADRTFPGRCRRNSRERQMGNPAENPLPEAVDEMLCPARPTTCLTKVQNQLSRSCQ
jgi:hypothetical protein